MAVKRDRVFRAVKAVLMRILNGGYRPQWVQIMSTRADRQRLREFCEKNGSISMIEGFHLLLDKAGCPSIPETAMSGKTSELIEIIQSKSGEYDNAKLAKRTKRGDFDDIIEAWISRAN